MIYNTPGEADVETARKARIVVGVKEEILGHLPPYDAIESLLASGDLTEADVSCEITVDHADTGFNASPHSQIHQYGIDVPEFPGPAFKVADSRGGKNLGGGGNFVLRSGMIYSISPTLVAKNGADTLLGGTSLVVTDEGYRELSARKVELLVSDG